MVSSIKKKKKREYTDALSQPSTNEIRPRLLGSSVTMATLLQQECRFFKTNCPSKNFRLPRLGSADISAEITVINMETASFKKMLLTVTLENTLNSYVILFSTNNFLLCHLLWTYEQVYTVLFSQWKPHRIRVI